MVADRGVELLEAPAVATPKGALIPTVLLRVHVGADGAVQSAEVPAPRPALAELEQRAVRAAARMRFRPALQGGQAVEAWTTVPLRFVPAARERTLQVKGSDTIGAALGPAWAEACERSEPGLHVRVEALGSNTGFAGLLDGSSEVAASSRLVRADELSFAQKLGVELREIVTGYDGIAVIVHPDNPVRELDLETLARIFAQRVTRWSELSGDDAPIHAFGRPSYSGTHGFFKERVFAALGQGAGFGASIEELESSREIVARVAADPHAIGYVSLGHVHPEVRVLALRPGPGTAAVAASAASIRDGSYPIARPLFLYLRTDAGRDARAFVDVALSPAGQGALGQHGFVPLGAPVLASLRDEFPAAPAPKPELLRVYFANASASVPSAARDTLNAAAALLRTGRRALVIGNADATGDLALNRRIAQRRAQAVAAALRRQGSGAAAIEIEVADSQHPLASNATAEGRSANRRVDVIVFGG